jgi:hypothetical protein
MQDGGRGGMFRVARRRCDWFAYGFYALPPAVGGSIFVEVRIAGAAVAAVRALL